MVRLRERNPTTQQALTENMKLAEGKQGDELDFDKEVIYNQNGEINDVSYDIPCQPSPNKGLSGDHMNVFVLFFLYVLQGIPLGLAGSIPMVLQNKGVTYKQQAMFSFVFWPFSLKLLWAPIVDAAYFKQFGRRKTWLVPTQYLIGGFMLLLSLVSYKV